MMNISVSTVKSGGNQILKLAGHGSLNLLATGKKATAKMKEHAESEGHILACQMETAAAFAFREGTVFQQIHRLEESERLKNRLAIRTLLRCTYFLARNPIAHTTNFGGLVDLTRAPTAYTHSTHVRTNFTTVIIIIILIQLSL